jgi:periplasmic protein CpxP/Spy
MPGYRVKRYESSRFIQSFNQSRGTKMSLKSKFVSVFASAMVLGSVAIVASAQTDAPAVKDGTEKAGKLGRKGFGRHGGFGKGMRGGNRAGLRGLRGIELTEAQKAQIKQIHEANRPDPALSEELKTIRAARRSGGTITDDQKARMRTLRGQMQAKRESVRQQVLAVLTPEQRQQLETRKVEMQKKREEMRQLRKQRRQAAPPATDSTNDN